MPTENQPTSLTQECTIGHEHGNEVESNDYTIADRIKKISDPTYKPPALIPRATYLEERRGWISLLVLASFMWYCLLQENIDLRYQLLTTKTNTTTNTSTR